MNIPYSSIPECDFPCIDTDAGAALEKRTSKSFGRIYPDRLNKIKSCRDLEGGVAKDFWY
jgi:hypothetical protein